MSLEKIYKAVAFLGLTLLHVLIGYGLHAWSITLAMEVAYRGRAGTLLDRAVHALSAMLSLPLVAPFVRHFYMQTPDSWTYTVYFLNSALWIAAGWLLIGWLRSRISRAA